jgi:hypothetical protein
MTECWIAVGKTRHVTLHPTQLLGKRTLKSLVSLSNLHQYGIGRLQLDAQTAFDIGSTKALDKIQPFGFLRGPWVSTVNCVPALNSKSGPRDAKVVVTPMLAPMAAPIAAP